MSIKSLKEIPDSSEVKYCYCLLYCNVGLI